MYPCVLVQKGQLQSFLGAYEWLLGCTELVWSQERLSRRIAKSMSESRDRTSSLQASSLMILALNLSEIPPVALFNSTRFLLLEYGTPERNLKTHLLPWWTDNRCMMKTCKNLETNCLYETKLFLLYHTAVAHFRLHL